MQVTNRYEAITWVKTWGSKMRKSILRTTIEGSALCYSLSEGQEKENHFSALCYLCGVSGRLYGDKMIPTWIK